MTYDAGRARDHTKHLLAVENGLRINSEMALASFLRVNPSWTGAHWADVLDVLDDSDSLLEVTEPAWDALHESVAIPALIPLVAITLAWAWKRPPTHDEVQNAVDTVVIYLPVLS